MAGEIASNKENAYYRKTPISRSIKQNGDFLFSKQRRRDPITPYIPPHRRKDSIDDGSLSSKKSESYQTSAYRVSTPYIDPRDKLFAEEEDTCYQKYNEKGVITQDMQDMNNTKNMTTQEINGNHVITQETNQSFSEHFNEERIKQSFNQDYGNQERITSAFTQENLRSSEVYNQEVYRKKLHQEKSSHNLNQSSRRKTSRENTSQKVSNLSTVEKVLKLSHNYMNTVYKSILYDMYFDKYKEKLPTKCLNAIKFCIQLDLDNSINEFLDAESHIEQNDQERRFLKDKEDCRHENSLLCQKELNKPKELDLKNIGKEFWVLIYNCESFRNIWGIIMDAEHFGKVEELADQLKNYFQFGNKLQKIKIEENSYYAVFDGSWHRVQCIKCNESTAEVFFIDRGDKDNISIDRLHKLDPKFLKLPAQAINMSLADLEMFTDCDSTHKMLDELLFEKAVYVLVKVSNAEKKPCLSVQLYKTEDNETIYVNELLMKKLFETVLNPLHYIQEDNAEHIEFLQTNETGLFIQLCTVSLKYFKLLMEDLIEKCCDENLKKQEVVRFESNKIYLVKRSRDNKFYRARVLEFKTENLIEVLLIDCGIITFINRENFFALEKLSTVFAQYPAQAIEVQLDQITILHPKIIDHIHSLTSNSNELYVKFLKAELENNNTPIIRLFKKVNGYLISVNDALLIEHNDILKCQSNKAKPSEDNFNVRELESVESKQGITFGQSKQKSVESNFGEDRLKLAEENFVENVPKSAERSFAEYKRKSAERSFGENKPKSTECSFGENKPSV